MVTQAAQGSLGPLMCSLPIMCGLKLRAAHGVTTAHGGFVAIICMIGSDPLDPLGLVVSLRSRRDQRSHPVGDDLVADDADMAPVIEDLALGGIEHIACVDHVVCPR